MRPRAGPWCGAGRRPVGRRHGPGVRRSAWPRWPARRLTSASSATRWAAASAGWLAAYGLCCNSVTAIELVTADGRAAALRRRARVRPLLGAAGRHGQLRLWSRRSSCELSPRRRALRGRDAVAVGAGGPGPAPLAHLDAGRPRGGDDLVGLLQVLLLPDIPEFLRGRQFVAIDGAVLGSEAYAAEVLAPLRALEPEIDLFAAAPPVALSHLHMDPEVPMPSAGDTVGLAAADRRGDRRDARDRRPRDRLAAEGRRSAPPRWGAEARGGRRGRAVADGGALRVLRGGRAHGAGARRGGPGGAAQLREAMAPLQADGAYLNFTESPPRGHHVRGRTFRALRAIKADVRPQQHHPGQPRGARRPRRPAGRTAGPATPGSPQSPVWIGDGWTMVDDAAVSQPKRSDWGSAATAPPSGSPAAVRAMPSRWRRMAPASAPGDSACSRASLTCTRAARKGAGGRRGRRRR